MSVIGKENTKELKENNNINNINTINVNTNSSNPNPTNTTTTNSNNTNINNINNITNNNNININSKENKQPKQPKETKEKKEKKEQKKQPKSKQKKEKQTETIEASDADQNNTNTNTINTVNTINTNTTLNTINTINTVNTINTQEMTNVNQVNQINQVNQFHHINQVNPMNQYQQLQQMEYNQLMQMNQIPQMNQYPLQPMTCLQLYPQGIMPITNSSDFTRAQQEYKYQMANMNDQSFISNTGIEFPSAQSYYLYPSHYCGMPSYQSTLFQKDGSFHQAQIPTKTKPCLLHELVLDINNEIYHCNTYSKSIDGTNKLQRIYVKRQSTTTKEPKIHEKKVDDGRIVIKEKERKITKQHEKLLNHIRENEEQIRSYNKFVVSRVLQEFKRSNPDIKISYGLVKKVLEQEGLLSVTDKKDSK